MFDIRLRLIFLCLLFPTTMSAQWNYHPIDIPMRDGKTLAADVYTTDLAVPKPVILIQTPYNKAPYRLGVDIPQAAGGAGFPLDTLLYNYVVMDWRGRFASTDAGPQGNIGEDGYDAVEWIAVQAWCNGKIGTWGPSALGQVQFATAKEQPPHLVCSVPLVKDYKTKYHDYYYGGVFRREHVDALTLLGFLTPDVILAHPAYDNTWKIVELTTDLTNRIAVPMLVIGGWYDHFPDGVLRAFHDMQNKSDIAVRSQHKLLFGPWIHGACTGAKQGILTYENADTVAVEAAKRFFDYHLLGAKNGWPLEPPVRYYQLGENEWRSTSAWTDLPKSELRLYLGDGNMLLNEPPGTASFSSFRYDPRDSSPSIGASRFTPFNNTTPIGPHDQAPVEARSDNLIFSTPVLTEDIEVNGPITVDLFVSSDRTDTDVAVRLCDVFPDGTSIIMTDGIKRGRFRNSLSTEEAMQPGIVYPVSVELQNLAITFKKGHRIRIIVTSSNFPRFDLNTNTGGPMYVTGDTLVAENSIHSGGMYPSRLVLPSPSPTRVPALDNMPSDLAISVYPHPVREHAQVQVSGIQTGKVHVTLTNILGRITSIHVGEAQGLGVFRLPGNLAPGVYLIRVRSNDAVASQRIIVRD